MSESILDSVNFEMRLDILSKSDNDNLPSYLYRDKDGYLRSKKTNNRAFRGIGSVEVIDTHNEIVDIKALKKTMDDLIDIGGVLLWEHKNIVAGKVLGWQEIKVYDEALQKSYPGVAIDFEIFSKYKTHKEILEHLDLPDGHPEKLSMLSLGGRKLKKKRECNTERCYNRVTQLEGHEFSLTRGGSNPLAFIIAKSKGVNMEEEEPRDQTELTIEVPDENPIPKDEQIQKMKEEETEDEETEESEESDEEEEATDEELKKSIPKIIKVLEKFDSRMSNIETFMKSIESKEEEKDTIIHNGKKYILKKTVDKKISCINSKLDMLMKGEKITPVQKVQPNESAAPLIVTPLQKRANEISKLSIEEKINLAFSGANKNRHIENLERMGVYL